MKSGILEKGTQRQSPQAGTHHTNHLSVPWEAKVDKIPCFTSKTSVWVTHLVGEAGLGTNSCGNVIHVATEGRPGAGGRWSAHP